MASLLRLVALIVAGLQFCFGLFMYLYSSNQPLKEVKSVSAEHA